MLVRYGPSAVLILEDVVLGPHLDGAVTTDRAARTWAGVLGGVAARSGIGAGNGEGQT